MKRAILIILAVVASLYICSEVLDYPKVTVNGKQYYKYTVQKSEGFYAVGKKFNVTTQDILDANPGLENLQLDQVIYIPLKSEAKEIAARPDTIMGEYLYHYVIPKETLYSLSKKYEVTVDDILAANAGMEALQSETTIKIPVKKSQGSITETVVVEEAAIVTNKEALKAELDSINASMAEDDSITENIEDSAAVAMVDSFLVDMDEAADSASSNIDTAFVEFRKIVSIDTTLVDSVVIDTTLFDTISNSIYNNGRIRVSIIMPFNIKSHSKKEQPIYDFYRGVLLAADSLRQEGYNIIFDVYDVGASGQSIIEVLNKTDFSHSDLIIGPNSKKQLDIVSSYVKARKIKCVIPFMKTVEHITDNEYLYQASSTPEELYGAAARSMAKVWKNRRFYIVVPDSAGVNFDKKMFADSLAAACARMGHHYQYISMGSIGSAAKGAGDTVIVLVPTTNKTLLTRMGMSLAGINSPRLFLMGFPEWNNVIQKELCSQSMYWVSSYFTNFRSSKTKRFYKRFYSRFGIPKPVSVPTTYIYGFDLTIHSVKMATGTLNDGDGYMVQTIFRYEKKGENGGYINNGFFMIRLDKNRSWK